MAGDLLKSGYVVGRGSIQPVSRIFALKRLSSIDQLSYRPPAPLLTEVSEPDEGNCVYELIY